MKHLPFAFLLFSCSLFLFQCQDSVDLPGPDPVTEFDCVTSPTVCSLTEANGHFAIDVFKAIHAAEDENSNIFISPLSISTALSMTMNGANSETLSEMQSTLRVDGKSLNEINDAYEILLEVLPKLDPEVTLKLANSIWYQTDYPVIPAFLDVNSMHFASEIVPIDFDADIEAAKAEVNNWIELNTDGLIKDAISELPGNVVMLLINAIYFKGTWQTEFDPELTQDSQFYASSGNLPMELMQRLETEVRYFENELLQAVDLPYGDSIYSMTVFLPKANHTAGELMNALSADSYQQWLDALQPTEINLGLPKFKIDYGTKLKTVLRAMGMEEAFTDRADFSQMIQGGGVKISDVIHKAFVEVDEAGTEAAAVTVVIIGENAAPYIPTFRADHPFVFVIRDNRTNSLLFMGKLMTVE